MVSAFENDNLAKVKNLIDELEIKCPISGTCNWTEVDSLTDVQNKSLVHLRILVWISFKTWNAQGIFLNYLNVQKTSRMKIPFGIAQTGKPLEMNSCPTVYF